LFLLHVITLALQPLKLAEGGGGVLVEAAGDGLGLLRLAKQDGVTPEYHRHVLDLVSVDPSQDFGAVWVRCTARDSVQRNINQSERLHRLPLHRNSISNPLMHRCKKAENLQQVQILK
uniref:Uncharacterized protein n=1 Tax=Oryzias latipes TaxID=8090 RepID=A0A3P9LZB0_ORYLA